jgi:hypothetical protein
MPRFAAGNSASGGAFNNTPLKLHSNAVAGREATMWFPEYPTWLARFNDREEICNRSLHTIVIMHVDRIEISSNHPEPGLTPPCPQSTTPTLLSTMYETFEHTADLRLHVAATDLEGLFTEAAHGLLSIFVDNPAAVRPQQEVEIRLTGEQYDYLLFD